MVAENINMVFCLFLLQDITIQNNNLKIHINAFVEE